MKIFNVNTLLAGIGGTLVLVVWGMVFWAWVYEIFGIFNKLPGDTDVVELLLANDTATGTYFYPWPRNTPETFANFVQQHRQGPFFQLSYIKEGVDPQAPGKILQGVFQYFWVSLLGVTLVRLSLTAPTSFWERFRVVVLAGIMGTSFIRLSDPIWFHLPWPHTIGNTFFEIVAWLLLGSVIAAILKP